jgi:hypothetical protein
VTIAKIRLEAVAIAPVSRFLFVFALLFARFSVNVHFIRPEPVQYSRGVFWARTYVRGRAIMEARRWQGAVGKEFLTVGAATSHRAHSNGPAIPRLVFFRLVLVAPSSSGCCRTVGWKPFNRV